MKKKIVSIIVAFTLVFAMLPLNYETASATTEVTYTWPTNGTKVVGHWGLESGHFYPYHYGIDITGSTGTNVYAAAPGKVIHAGWYKSYGRCVQIEHANGQVTLYAHNSSIVTKKGATVKRGDIIAKIGGSGRNSSGNNSDNVYTPHLHFGIYKNASSLSKEDGRNSKEITIDPESVLKKSYKLRYSDGLSATSYDEDEKIIPSQRNISGVKEKTTSLKFTRSGYEYNKWYIFKLIDGEAYYWCREKGTDSNAKWIKYSAIPSNYYKVTISHGGSIYFNLSNGAILYLTPVWEKHTHKYDNSCDSTCNTCSYTRTASHSWIDATCTYPSYCSKCGTVTGSSKGHMYTEDYVVDVAATKSNDGNMSIYCTRSGCNEKYSTVTIPKIASEKLSSTLYTYDGKAKTPSVTVKDVDGNVLEKDTDYTVTYPSSRTKIGKYTVTINYIGKYSGTTKLTYTIGPKNPEAVKATLYGHDDVQFSWDKVEGATGYKIYYKKAGESSYTTLGTTKGTSCKKADLADNTKYDFKVIAYQNVNGVNCYNTGKTCSVTTKVPTTDFKTSLSSTLYTYDGNAKTPSVTVKDTKGNTLVKDTDYTVTYPSSRTKIGKYTVTITYKGKYYGSTKLTYTIGPKNPTTVKAALYGHDDVQLTWSTVSGAAGYKVYYKKSTDSSYTTVGTTTATSYKIPNLADGAKYTFKVITYQKVSGNNCYNAGKTCELTMLKKVPGIAVAKSSSSVKVSWTDIAGQSGYQISQATAKDETTIVATFATTSGTSKVVTATKGKTYYYKVRAYKTEGDKKIYGPWSDVVSYKLS